MRVRRAGKVKGWGREGGREGAWGEEEERGRGERARCLAPAGGRREGLAFIDGNQTGLDGDEADVRSLQRRRKRRFSE